MSMRCFIAVEIEDRSTLMNILKFKRELELLDLDAKFVEDENVHITIRFLGEIGLATVEGVKKILQDLGKVFSKFEMEIKGFGAFPSLNNPRVLWIGVGEGSEHLYNVRRYIDAELTKKGFADIHKDPHEFHPHITIARIKSRRKIDLLHKLFAQYNDYYFGVSPVTEIKLKQSILRPQGPVYRDIFVVRLG